MNENHAAKDWFKNDGDLTVNLEQMCPVYICFYEEAAPESFSP